MRKLEREMNAAIASARIGARQTPQFITTMRVHIVRLHGNKIAEIMKDGLTLVSGIRDHND